MKSDQTAPGPDDPFIDNSRIVFIIDSDSGRSGHAEVIHRCHRRDGPSRATSPPTSTLAFLPNTTPLGLTRKHGRWHSGSFDQGLLAAGYPVQRYGILIGLCITNCFIFSYIKLRPVDEPCGCYFVGPSSSVLVLQWTHCQTRMFPPEGIACTEPPSRCMARTMPVVPVFPLVFYFYISYISASFLSYIYIFLRNIRPCGSQN